MIFHRVRDEHWINAASVGRVTVQKGRVEGLALNRVPWEQKPFLVCSLSKLGDKWLSEGPSSLGIAAALCSLALPFILAHHNF